MTSSPIPQYDRAWSLAWQSNKWASRPAGQFALDTGELDFRPPAAVADRIREAADCMPSAYCWPNGVPQVRQAIAGLYAGMGRPTEPNDIYLTPGAKIALRHIYSALLEPGSRVVVMGTPAYRTVVTTMEKSGVRIDYVPLLARADGWELDLDAARRLVTPETTAIIVNTPHNPTGHMASAAELVAIAELAERSGAIVVSDELNEFLALDAPHLAIADLVPDLAPRVITVTGFGKGFGIGGFKVGHIVHRGPLMNMVEKRIGKRHIQPSTLAQFAAWGCVDAAPVWLPALRALLLANRALVATALKGIEGLEFRLPAGGFSFWLQLPPGFSSLAVQEALLDQSGIAVLATDEYAGVEREGIRIVFGTDTGVLKNAVVPLRNGLAGLLREAIPKMSTVA